MASADNEQRRIQEARENFRNAQRALQGTERRLNRIAGATQQEKADVIKDLATQLADAYEYSEVTPEPADNIFTRKKEAEIRQKIHNFITSGSLPASMEEYFVGYITFLRVKDFHPSSGTQDKLLGDVRDAMAASVADIGWPELEADYKVIDAQIDTLEKNKQEAYKYGDLEGKELYQLATTFVNWDTLSKEDVTLGTPIHTVEDIPNLQSVIRRAAQLVDAESRIDQTQRSVLEGALESLRQDAFVFKGKPAVSKEIRNLRSVIYRILHESRVISIERDKKLREYLRPSTNKIQPPEIYGEMMMFLGEVGGSSIDDAEAMGLLVATATDKKTALTPDQVDKLKKLRDRITSIKKKYADLRVTSRSISDNDSFKYLTDLLKEIDKYVTWVQKLISEVETAPTTVAAAREAGEYNLNDPDRDEAAREWRRYIDDNDTVSGLDDIGRLLITKIYHRDDVVPTYELSEKDDRIESAVYQYWRSRVAVLRGPASHKDPEHRKEFEFLLNKYEHLLRLKDADLVQANTASLTSDVLNNLETYETDVRRYRMSEKEYFYFLNAATNPESEYTHFEHSEKVKWGINKVEELLTETLDPHNVYDPNTNPDAPGRFWGFNFNEATDNAKVDLRARLHKEIAAQYGEDPESPLVAEVADIVMCIAGVSAIRFDTYAEPLLLGISPRNILAARLSNINEFFPASGAAYSTYAGEKYLEISLSTEVDHHIEEGWEYLEELDFPPLADVHKRLHDIEESYRGTRLVREQMAPLRKRYKITYMPGHKVIKAPMPSLYQCFVANSEAAEKAGYSLPGWVDGVRGYKDFQEKVMAEIKVEKGGDLAHTRLELVHKLESALDTFSKIKNVNVDWGYFAHMVLHLVDKLYFAYADVDATVAGSERLYELLVEKFGLLVGQRYWTKRITDFPHTPHPDVYLKLAPQNTFMEDGVEWTIGDYLVTQLEERGVFWGHMTEKRHNQHKPVDPVPATPKWVDHNDEVKRRQPWKDRTTKGALAKKAAYFRFRKQHPTFEHTVRLYGTGKAAASKTATELDSKGGGH